LAATSAVVPKGSYGGDTYINIIIQIKQIVGKKPMLKKPISNTNIG
jgi:hypothetical protein